MHKILSKILISVMLVGIFLLPFSGALQIKNMELLVATEKSEVNAQEAGPWHFVSYSQSIDTLGNVDLLLIYTSGEYTQKSECDADYIAYQNAHPGQVTEACTGPDGSGLGSGNFVNVLDENGKKVPPEGDGINFGCTWWKPLSLNCLIAALYYMIYQPLAWITAGAAAILDYFVYYSISDDAYENTFVEKGWGTVRDIANIFFIIGLLFIAIKTILGLNTTNNKKMLTGIILFALVINFSLFATRVVVDASNILANIFYHQIEPVDGNGVRIGENKDQRSVTIGLVRTFDPADLVSGPLTNGEVEIDDIRGKFLLMTILSIILMGYMIYIFLSVSFLFVARVISLWIAMIFSPLAFASHAISPKIKGFGWEEWLSGLLKTAFMAPLFIFFLYIIILFGDIFENVATASGSDDTFILSAMNTIIPFMLVFVLLHRAKKLASDYAGEMGKAVTTGAAAIGGLALGGAALGTAFVGRTVIGRGTAALSRREGATKYGEEKIKFNEKVKDWERTGKTGPKPKWEDHKKATGVSGNVFDRLGGRINYAQKKTSDVDHARHELDEAQKKAGLEGIDQGHLSGANITKIKETFIKDKKTEIESDLKKGDEKALKLVKDPGLRDDLKDGEGGYKAKRRKKLVSDMHAKGDKSEVDAFTGELTDQGKKKIENTLDVEFTAILKKATNEATETKYTELKTKAEQGVNIGTRVASKSTSGSYDIRDATKIVADKRSSIGFKGTALLIAAVAGAIRLGVKKGYGAEPSKSQGDIRKDLSGLIKDSLNVKVDLSSSTGGDAGHSKPSGGGHGGGH